MINQSFTDSGHDHESSNTYSLNEGEIAGILIGTVFMIFLVIPVVASYILVCFKRLHGRWKNRRAGSQHDHTEIWEDFTDSEGDGDSTHHVQLEMKVTVPEEHLRLPRAELTHSEPPPSYRLVTAGECKTADPLVPPTYETALDMDKV